jgi:hypothetical protein
MVAAWVGTWWYYKIDKQNGLTVEERLIIDQDELDQLSFVKFVRDTVVSGTGEDRNVYQVLLVIPGSETSKQVRGDMAKQTEMLSVALTSAKWGKDFSTLAVKYNSRGEMYGRLQDRDSYEKFNLVIDSGELKLAHGNTLLTKAKDTP